MNRLILSVFFGVLMFSAAPQAFAGNCRDRDVVDWHIKVSSATNIRVECDDHKGPVGDSLGVASAGALLKVLEVDKNREYFMVEMNGGVGFIYKSFIAEVIESPLPVPEVSVFADLDLNHQYYAEIKDLKEQGIVSGTPEGKILADTPVNRAELAKILVEAVSSDTEIAAATLADGVFSDVLSGAWYLPYLEMARRMGVMNGDAVEGGGVTTVRPGDSANGAEVAKMIGVAFALDVRTAVAGEAYYSPYMEKLSAMGALPYSDPGHVVTRGEMMFMISMVLKAKG